MTLRSLFLVLAICPALPAQEDVDPIAELEAWLGKPPAQRSTLAEQAFARVSLSKEQAEEAQEFLAFDLEATLRPERKAEWKQKRIKLGERVMPFEYKVFGKAKKGKRSLFISMHGGGSAPKATNDQQWRNQIKLYEPKEGVYLAPRAPTDSWNMWHQAHIDDFFRRIIEDAVLFEGVSFDRVYLTGYSAGGDGVYQLAPRMADRLAAAAMMAGHPNETKALGLRNLPFTLHMGGKDAAFKRNEVAADWKSKLAELRKADPQGYEHKVVIHAGKGHWMDREDRVALTWMQQHTRTRRPKRVVWLQDDVTHARFYWLGMPEAARQGRPLSVARIEGQKVIIEKDTTAKALTVYLDDELLDVDDAVTLVEEGKPDVQLKVYRTIEVIAETLELDPARVYCAKFEVTRE